MLYKKRLISIFTPSVLMALTCLPLIDEKELAKTRLEMKKGEREVQEAKFSAFLTCVYVLKPCGLIPWKHFPLYFCLFSSPSPVSDLIFKNGNYHCN